MFRSLSGVGRKAPFLLTIRDEQLEAHPGESLAASLLRDGWLKKGRSLTRPDLKRKSPWNYYCGIGICGECRVQLGDGRSVLACQHEVDPEKSVQVAPRVKREAT